MSVSQGQMDSQQKAIQTLQGDSAKLDDAVEDVGLGGGFASAREESEEVLQGRVRGVLPGVTSHLQTLERGVMGGQVAQDVEGERVWVGAVGSEQRPVILQDEVVDVLVADGPVSLPLEEWA